MSFSGCKSALAPAKRGWKTRSEPNVKVPKGGFWTAKATGLRRKPGGTPRLRCPLPLQDPRERPQALASRTRHHWASLHVPLEPPARPPHLGAAAATRETSQRRSLLSAKAPVAHRGAHRVTAVGGPPTAWWGAPHWSVRTGAAP